MFDLRTTEVPKKQGSYSPVPEGDYQLTVTDAEIKDTKAGTGKYVKLTLEIVGGEHEGRKVWQLFNVVNPNPEAVRISKEQMKSMLLASGLPEEKCVIKDVNDFMALTFKARLKVDGDNNKVHYFIQTEPEEIQKMKAQAKKAESQQIPW